MTMHGSLSIENRPIRWSKADFDRYLMSASIGVLAGLAVTYLRMPLHMPGHKVLLWMVPALACRLTTRARAGASTSVLGTIGATLLLGGQLGGGVIMMPLVACAGIVLDVAAGIVERHRLAAWPMMTLLGLAGVAGNLICFIKRLSDPVGQMFSSGNVKELLSAGGSYIVFGLLAGIIGAIFGWGIVKHQERTAKRLAESL